MNLYLDIETIPDQRPGAKERIAAEVKPPGNIKKQETIDKWWAENGATAAEEAWRKTSLDGGQGEIVAIGFMMDDWKEPRVLIRHPIDDPAGEASLLTSFYALLQGLEEMPTRWVGHNIIDFDLPFLWKRSVIHGVQPTIPMPVHVQPWHNDVFDTMKEWFGYRNMGSLDRLVADLGLDQGKLEGVDGSMVWDLVQAGKWGELDLYCGQDVLLTKKLYSRLTFTPERAA